MHIKILLTLLFLTLTWLGAAQEKTVPSRYINQMRAGIITFAGIPFYDLPEGNRYTPLLIGGYTHFPLFKTKKFFNISLDFIPHGGISLVGDQAEFEFGLNMFVNASFAIKGRNILSLNIGSGPHYISVETERQAKGYIFSDNFMLAYKRLVKDTLEIGFYGGFRHISNAGIKEPNKGIDDVMMGILISKGIKK